MIKTSPIHIITFKGREFDRTTTPWEIAKETKEGTYKELNGVPTFDFR